MNSKEWFKNAKFGMMIHFGLYSLIGGEWKGKRMDNVAEWAMSYFKIPIKEYEKLAEAFNPIYFNADEIVSLAKNAGMEYIVLTSKHHEGFALFKSEVDKFNVVDATPYKKDIVAEMAAACKKQGVKFGLYYSQEDDWHEEHGGGYTAAPDFTPGFDATWSNTWDFPDNGKKDYSICFEKKIKPQVEEILKNYGDLCLIWFDNAITINDRQSEELYNLVKKYQPNCLINSRIGNDRGDYISTGDNEIDKEREKDMLYECPATMNTSWGYKYYDDKWKTAEEIIAIKNKLNERGINYLLNIGPDNLGRVPAPAVEVLKELAERRKK